MKNGPFNEAIAQHLGLDLALVKQLSRALREANLLTTGARGVNAPHMVARDAARLVIAALAGSIPSTVVEDVFGWGSYQVAGIHLGASTKKGPFCATDPDESCTLEDALTGIFDLYGREDVLAAHTWKLSGLEMQSTLMITLSERLRTVNINECGTEIIFGDVKASKDFKAANDQQSEALDRWNIAVKANDVILMDAAEAEAASAAGRAKAAFDRMISGKQGLRVSRSVAQEEILPIARALIQSEEA